MKMTTVSHIRTHRESTPRTHEALYCAAHPTASVNIMHRRRQLTRRIALDMSEVYRTNMNFNATHVYFAETNVTVSFEKIFSKFEKRIEIKGRVIDDLPSRAVNW